MAEHKSAAEVTVVAHEEQSAFAAFVERHWMKAAIVAVIGTAAILFMQYQEGQKAAAIQANWDKLMACVEDNGAGIPTGEPAAIEAVLPEIKGTDAEAWGLFYLAASLRGENKFEEAVAALGRLKDGHPKHPLVADLRTFGESSTPVSRVAHLTNVYASESQWRTKNPGLFANPEPAASAPRARIQTDHGDILIALDAERAPKHVENFTKLVNEGFYNGLKVHRSSFGQVMELGDPTTKDEASLPITWGQQGAEENVEKEDTGLSHFRGVLSANEVIGTEESSGSLVTITAEDSHHLNSRNVVFGHVIEGQEIVKEIALLPSAPGGQTPEEPAVIQSITIVPGS